MNFRMICIFVLMLATLWGNERERKEKKAMVTTELFLKGSPYDLGYQHGTRLKEAIAYNIKRLIDDKILANREHPQIKAFLDMLPQLIEHIPHDYIEEMKGLAEGSGIAYEKILLLNLFPEMFHCSGLTVKGQATKGETLYHVRVLDYAVGMDLQDTAVLMIVQPDGKLPFLNVSYAGFIGSVTGMNAEHIAVGEIGGKGYGDYQGMPMAFLLRNILEKAQHLQDVKHILAATPRTCEYYYVFSDGKTKESIGVYATSHQFQLIEPGSDYALFDTKEAPLGIAGDKFLLKKAHIESSLYQTVLYQDEQKQKLWGLVHHQPDDCLILIGFCHVQRYPHLVQGLLARYGQIEVQDLQKIIKGNAGRATNLHTAIFAPTTLDVWIAHAGLQGQPAWSQPYAHFNLGQLLQK